MDRKSVRAVLLTVSTFSYLLLGAAVFDHLESENDTDLRDEIKVIRQKMHDKDWQLLETIVVRGIPHKAGFQWHFTGAFYFCVSVVTTVGYGHSAPSTVEGKLFCMLFAIAGIPLGLIMFQSIGERVNTGIAFCLNHLRDVLRTNGIEFIRDVTPKHLLCVSFSVGWLGIAVGTYVFHRYERWTIFEAFYYCVITLSTIGFGDYVPLQKEGALQKDTMYVLFTLLFIVLGLAIFSACVNLLVLGFMAPNVDAVTAAPREPPRTIVFETFAPARSNSRDERETRRTSREKSIVSAAFFTPRSSAANLQKLAHLNGSASKDGCLRRLCKRCGLLTEERIERVDFATVKAESLNPEPPLIGLQLRRSHTHSFPFILSSTLRVLGAHQMVWPQAILLPLSIVLFTSSTEGKIFRVRRQMAGVTMVNSNGTATGIGDDVDTSASAHHYKTVDGVIGVNSTSEGNASGMGVSQINNTVYGGIGGTEVSGIGDVYGSGTNSDVESNIFAQIYGGNQTIINYQEGAADGTRDTYVAASGQSMISQNGTPGFFNSPNTIAEAGAYGSEQSSSNVVSNQQLTWESLLAQLVGMAQAQGILNASALVDLGAGNAENGIEVNGAVLGYNQGGGSAYAEAQGSGTIEGETHDLANNMYGNTSGTNGQTQLVQAGNLQSNLSGVNNTIISFGDSIVNSNGNSEIAVNSSANVNTTSGTNGGIQMNATADGATKNMTVNNGLQINDANGGTLGIGYGEIVGNGTENSNAQVSVDTQYTADGNGQVVVNGDGNSLGQGQNSALNIGGTAFLNNTEGMQNYGGGQASGAVSGTTNNLTGNTFLDVDATGVSGNSMMEGFANALNGTASANTGAALQLIDAISGPRNVSIQGGVSATGQNVSVHSVSVVTDYNGQQSVSNYQQASSIGGGNSSASASNSGSFRRRRRRSIEYLKKRLL